MTRRVCQVCDVSLEGRQASARTCSVRCRKAASRARQQSWVVVHSRRFGIPEKDFWRTPGWLFAALDREFRFTLDAASSGEDDALCPEWLTPDEDARACVWPVYLHLMTSKGAAFCNPPYSPQGGPLQSWVEACIRARARQTVVLVGPAEITSEWYHLAVEHADEVRHIRKRVRFVPPPGLPSSTPRGGTVVAIFREGSHGPATVVPGWDPRAQSVTPAPRGVTSSATSQSVTPAPESVTGRNRPARTPRRLKFGMELRAVFGAGRIQTFQNHPDGTQDVVLGGADGTRVTLRDIRRDDDGVWWCASTCPGVRRRVQFGAVSEAQAGQTPTNDAESRSWVTP